MSLTRRNFLQAVAPLGLAPFLPACDDEELPPGEVDPVFQHGVASGDPLHDRVILWTRVTPQDGSGQRVSVGYAVARDEQFQSIVLRGQVSTGPEVDYTVKIDAAPLVAGRTYYYAFTALDHLSPVGRTKTLPSGRVDRLRMAVASCSNYPAGFFNGYALIAARADLDLVLHLGDYLYEYEEGGFGTGSSLGRAPDPPHETLTLEDYRRRHAQYKSDQDLQAAHRRHPFCTVWDDHESANNAHKDGAENHQPATEGEWQVRLASAIQAYREWMPIRDQRPDEFERIYRSFSLGNLVDLVLLDTRIIGRDPQLADPCDPAVNSPERTLLGTAQEAWLLEQLSASKARGTRWRLVGQQVMFGQLANVLVQPVCPFNTDQWDGYAAGRARVLGALTQNGIDNVVILTGDIHASWALDVTSNPFDPTSYDGVSGRGSLAVEFITPAITSPGIEDPVQAAALTGLLHATHPHVKFVDLSRRGYLLLDVTHERVRAEWYFVRTLEQRRAEEDLGAASQVLAGTNHLSPVPGAPALAPPPAIAVGG